MNAVFHTSCTALPWFLQAPSAPASLSGLCVHRCLLQSRSLGSFDGGAAQH